jgi:hypothetical protein
VSLQSREKDLAALRPLRRISIRLSIDAEINNWFRDRNLQELVPFTGT